MFSYRNSMVDAANDRRLAERLQEQYESELRRRYRFFVLPPFPPSRPSQASAASYSARPRNAAPGSAAAGKIVLSPINMPMPPELQVTNHENIEFLDLPLSDDLACPVCLNSVAFAPVNLNCSHVLCRPCAERIENKKCGECRSDFPHPLQLNSYLQQKVWQRQASCQNAAHGCVWQGAVGKDYHAYKAHNKECQFRPIKCGACETDVLVKDVAAHKDSCDARIVQCEHCLKSMEFAKMALHRTPAPVQGQADHAPCVNTRLCPNECQTNGKCTVLVTENLADHTQRVCALRKVTCDYCHGMVLATKRSSHMLSCGSKPITCTECHVTMKYSEMAAHLKAESIRFDGRSTAPACRGMEFCPYRCKTGVDQLSSLTQVARESLVDHCLSCPQRREKCNLCSNDVIASKLQDHQSNSCIMRLVLCPCCKGTSARVPFQQLESHVLDQMKSNPNKLAQLVIQQSSKLSESADSSSTAPAAAAAAAAGAPSPRASFNSSVKPGHQIDVFDANLKWRLAQVCSIMHDSMLVSFCDAPNGRNEWIPLTDSRIQPPNTKSKQFSAEAARLRLLLAL